MTSPPPKAGSAGMAGPPAAGPEPAATAVVDALGRKCPIPIIMLAGRIGEVPAGSVLEVLADDPAAKTDVPAWCGLKSHEYVGARVLPGGGWAFAVRRLY